ncbi:MAG: trimethylamine methyltransferase [Desulfobacterales bacterium C00003060]|nr:MAG: trimethylamine methyltransferase [Desulfobacterales bacterium S3730MH5]OEU77369.1 MAG: trimethylamine methyltransferase [Desulfobacterales bacterium C00003060]
MNVRRGLSGGHYKPLSDQDIKKIHETSLRVFAEVGLQVNFPAARELFLHAGAEVDEASRTVKVPPGMVEELINKAPSVVQLCGRAENGELDCEIGGKKVYLGTGGTALNVQNPGTRDCRRATLEDVVNMARLVDVLDNIHFYMLNVYPDDLPVERVDVNRFGAALNRTRKHVMGGVYTIDGVRNVIKMAEFIAGSPQKLRERPFISMVTCPISPFKLDESYAQLTMEAARNRIPVVVPVEPLCGATAPITLAGNLVVQNVDTLAGLMLAQLASSGTPTLYGCISSITDLRDMKYLSGAVEMGLMNAAASQMAQFYMLPCYVTAGMSDSKVNDAQAGYESAITTLMVALAGGNFIHDAAGFLEFCMTASYDKLVIDNEIIGMVMRAVEGIQVNDETLAFDLIKKTGPGGHFVSARHTRRHMRSEQYVPQLSDREERTKWKAAGANDAEARASQKVKEILNEPRKPVIPSNIRERIKREIPGLRSFVMD